MKNIKLNDKLNLYLQWPIIFSFFLILMNAGIYIADTRLGCAASLLFLMYIVLSMTMYYYRTPKLLGMMARYSNNYDKVQNQLMDEMIFPYGILDCNGALIWGNEQFIQLIEDEKSAKKSICNIFEEINITDFPKDKMVSELHIKHNDTYYRVIMKNVIVKDSIKKNKKNVVKTKEEELLY
nr:hypothetical protein [Lachnospiraceae bacterium]